MFCRRVCLVSSFVASLFLGRVATFASILFGFPLAMLGLKDSLISLLHLLEYVGLDDRMALLTRSVGESISDLIPFMILFVIFVAIFACIGHLLYGPVLLEWSTISNSLRTAIDIMIGNYMFEQLQEGIPEDKSGENLVGALFFYIYFFLMMLIALNIVISILMDG